MSFSKSGTKKGRQTVADQHQYDGPSRADFERVIAGVTAKSSFVLQREGLTRMWRALQVLSGTDPNAGKAPVNLTPDDVLLIHMLLLDATQSPFRTNGKQIVQGTNVPATGGNFSRIGIGVRPPDDPKVGNQYGVLVVDSVDYEGAADNVLGVTSFSNPAGQIRAIDFETPVREFGANDTLPKMTRFDQVAVFGSAIATVYVDGTDFAQMSELGGTPAAGPSATQLLGCTIWPGSALVIQQKVVNLAFRATFRGHYWDLGSILGASLFKG